MKILYLDIETAPALALTFSTFKPFIPIDAVVEDPYILCFTYQWHDKGPVRFVVGEDILPEIHRLLDEADIVIGYNSQSFDIKWIEGELILGGYKPPSPFRQIDLYRELKKRSRFISGKLDYAAKRLLDERKVSHEGILLWWGCMNGDAAAWRKMKKYAIKDTALLKPLYLLLRPWIKNHPVMTEEFERACSRCQSENIQLRGWERTQAGKFRRFHCLECGGWGRLVRREASTGDVRPL